MNDNKKLTIWLAIPIILLVASGVLLVLSLAYTNPKTIGPGGVTFWFINLLVLLCSMGTLLVFMIRMSKKDARANKLKTLSESFRTSFLVGFCAVVLIALSSLRSLGIRDIILFILTVVLIEIYFRTRAQKQ